MTTCYCGSNSSFENCCKPYIKGYAKAPTAEALMRSRYSAYATQNADYLVATTHISTRKFHKKSDILDWSKSNQWIKLEVLSTTETTVTFKAYFLDYQLKAQTHHEHSNFIFENGSWFYVDGNHN
ncbi:MAG: YchJ family metal-binding protein [Flavobacterium sp.]|uniref:YchJ family protein n=1 Tax=Flavobacterium sp. TaxID=239 RepID=UPI0022C1C9EA|nr:YchJ family metal-binding protein [Flavobacterium sp.]MCZ8198584.1 YchJ family metal-binding protein [Flavobacterium sp.]